MEANNKAAKVWLEALDKVSPGVRRRYILALDKFLESQGISTAEELYQLKLQEKQSPDTRDQGGVERKIESHIVSLVRDGLHPGTARNNLKAILSFFKSQNLPLKINTKSLPKKQSIGMKIILRDQIAKAWDMVGLECRLKNRAVLMFLKDSGLRNSDVSALDIGDYRNAVVVKNEAGEPFKVFDDKVTQKCGIVGIIHIGPESIQAVDEYLKTERLGAEDTEPLFTNLDGGRATGDSIGKMISLICQKQGSRLGSHSFRKFHTTTLQGAGLSDSWIKILQGKSLDPSMGSYSKPQESGELTPAYIRAYPKLKIHTNIEFEQRLTEQSKKITEQDERIKAQEKELSDLKQYVNLIDPALDVTYKRLEEAEAKIKALGENK